MVCGGGGVRERRDRLITVIYNVIYKCQNITIYRCFHFEWHSRGQWFDPAYLRQGKHRIAEAFSGMRCLTSLMKLQKSLRKQVRLSQMICCGISDLAVRPNGYLRAVVQVP